MLLVVGILGVLYLVLPVKVIEFSQQDVDNAIKSKIPYAIVDGIAHVTISAATLQLRHENMITGNISFEAAAITLEGVGVSTFESGVRYQSGNFYLADLKKDDIQFEFSSNSIETMGDVRSTLEDLLNREATEAAANQDVEKASRINSVRVYAETQLKIDVEVALDKFIKNAPIFSLNDQGSWLKLAAMALDEVTISEGKIRVTLSFQTFIIRVIIALLSTLLLGFLYLSYVGPNIWSWLPNRNSS